MDVRVDVVLRKIRDGEEFFVCISVVGTRTDKRARRKARTSFHMIFCYGSSLISSPFRSSSPLPFYSLSISCPCLPI